MLQTVLTSVFFCFLFPAATECPVSGLYHFPRLVVAHLELVLFFLFSFFPPFSLVLSIMADRSCENRMTTHRIQVVVAACPPRQRSAISRSSPLGSVAHHLRMEWHRNLGSMPWIPSRSRDFGTVMGLDFRARRKSWVRSRRRCWRRHYRNDARFIPFA